MIKMVWLLNVSPAHGTITDRYTHTHRCGGACVCAGCGRWRHHQWDEVLMEPDYVAYDGPAIVISTVADHASCRRLRHKQHLFYSSFKTYRKRFYLAAAIAIWERKSFWAYDNSRFFATPVLSSSQKYYAFHHGIQALEWNVLGRGHFSFCTNQHQWSSHVHTQTNPAGKIFK